MQDKNRKEDREIHQAAKAGDLTALRRLLFADRTSIEASNPSEIKPLHYAAGSGSLECVKFLVENEADVNSNDLFGQRPLHYAAGSGSLECVKFLVKNGADVNALCIENRMTAIFEARTEEIATFLVENGAILDIVSTKGRVPLDCAIQGGRIEVIRYLISCGVDINYRRKVDCFNTMTQWAICGAYPRETSEQVLEMILKAGGDPNQQNAFGSTALHLAVSRKSKYMVELLLKYGADPCIRDEYGSSCFDRTNDESILELLEPYKANLVEISKKQDDFETLIERLIATGISSRNQLIPCSEEEIINLEISYAVKLSLEYKKFLRVMGNGAGSFLITDHWHAFLPSFNDFLSKNFFEDEDIQQPDNFFVFASRMGDYVLGFFANGTSDDPEIYGIDYEGNIEKVYDSIWGFIQEMVEYYEFYLNPQRFTQSNISGRS